MTEGAHEAVPDPRNEQILIYVDGDLVPRVEAKVSVYDSGFMVGDGVWESMRLTDGVFVFLDEHLDRLFMGAKAIGLDLGMARDEIAAALAFIKSTWPVDIQARQARRSLKFWATAEH